RAGRPGKPEPVGARGVTGHAGDQPVAGLAGQAGHPGAAASNYARPRRVPGAGSAGGGDRTRPRSAAAFPGHGHAVHTASRELLRQLTGSACTMNDVAVIDRFLETFARYIDSGFGLLQGEVAFLTATLIVIDMTLAGLF